MKQHSLNVTPKAADQEHARNRKRFKKKKKTKDSNCSAGVSKQDMWHAFIKPSNSMTIPKKEQKTVFNFPHEKLSHETGH